MPGLPTSAQRTVAGLLNEPLMPVERLAEAVADYRRLIERAVETGFVHANVALGSAIADALTAFLGRVDQRTGPEALRVIQVAVRYFVIESDGFGHDLEHEDGLFGDARVVNAMLRWFGRDDLALALPASAAERRAIEPGALRRPGSG